MKQRNNAYKRLYYSCQRQLPYFSICCLGSFSLLSSGLVFAQTQSAVDNIVPTVGNQAKSNTGLKLNSSVVPEQIHLHQSHSNVDVSQSPSIGKLKAELEQKKVQVKLAAPVNISPDTSVSTITHKSKDYNNAYIDPTNYSGNSKVKYEAPSSVVITELSSGCRTILSNGTKVSGCNTPRQNVADNAPSSGKKSPSWIRKSENVHLASVATLKSESTQTADATPVAKDNTESNAIHQADTKVANSLLHLNRFLPKPSEFNPQTTVSSVPLAPSGGSLPAPMTADNFAPRPSIVAYNIPLASLPQIAYAGNLNYGNSSGMLFPLTIAAPITSLFGWRVHPITGEYRFHAGIDLGAATGSPILAAYSGSVEVADYVSGYGLTVILNHKNAEQTLYGHMSEILVRPGQWVQQGTVIGLVGSTGMATGPHLHFEIRHLTPSGWVAVNPSNDLETALNQFNQGIHTAQVPQSNK